MYVNTINSLKITRPLKVVKKSMKCFFIYKCSTFYEHDKFYENYKLYKKFVVFW